jgi:hypothetical protein
LLLIFTAMEEIDFTIDYKGEERHFTAVPKKYGYTFRIEVIIENRLVAFEPDEEGQLRAIIETPDAKSSGNMDSDLIRAIATELQEGLK